MENGGSEVGSMWQSCCRLFYEEKRLSSSHLLTNFIYPLWLHNRQPSCLFSFYHLFCAGMNTTCWSPEAQSLLLLPLSLLKLWVWSAPPLDDQDLLTKRKRVSEELRLLLQIGAVKRKNKIADQLLDWMRLNNETDRTLLEDLSEE